MREREDCRAALITEEQGSSVENDQGIDRRRSSANNKNKNFKNDTELF